MFPPISNQFYHQIYLVLCILTIVEFTKCETINKGSIEDEMKDEFLTKLKTVLEHDDVKVHRSLHKRAMVNGYRVKFKAFDKDVDKYLNPDDAILFGEHTPVWIINGTQHYKRFRNGVMKRALDYYQRDPARAAMVIRPREGSELYNFRPSLEHMMKKNKLKREIPEMDMEHMNTVYPTILVTTDFNLGVKSTNEEAWYDQMIYQMAYWNAVDLKFRQMKDPKVRLRIAGILMAMDREATPYLHRNSLHDQVQIFNVLNPMASHWGGVEFASDFPPESFHIVTTMTNLKLVDENHPGDLLAGLATTVDICSNNEDRFGSVAVLNDDLGFSSVNVAAHELSHVFGIFHDNGTEDGCTEKDGYIMSALIRPTKNNGKFSKCSLITLSTALREHDCLNEPKDHWSPGLPLGRILPGTFMTPDAQCKAQGYEWACQVTADICKNLQCSSPSVSNAAKTSWECDVLGGAAEGTSCGNNRICLNNECRSPFPPKNKNGPQKS